LKAAANPAVGRQRRDKHTSIEIVANEMMILGDRRDSGSAQPKQKPLWLMKIK
jgi:hypothetical protein